MQVDRTQEAGLARVRVDPTQRDQIVPAVIRANEASKQKSITAKMSTRVMATTEEQTSALVLDGNQILFARRHACVGRCVLLWQNHLAKRSSTLTAFFMRMNGHV